MWSTKVAGLFLFPVCLLVTLKFENLQLWLIFKRSHIILDVSLLFNCNLISFLFAAFKVIIVTMAGVTSCSIWRHVSDYLGSKCSCATEFSDSSGYEFVWSICCFFFPTTVLGLLFCLSRLLHVKYCLVLFDELFDKQDYTWLLLDCYVYLIFLSCAYALSSSSFRLMHLPIFPFGCYFL